MGNTSHLSGNGAANSHKANMPPKKTAKVSLRFLILIVPYGWEYEAVCAVCGDCMWGKLDGNYWCG